MESLLADLKEILKNEESVKFAYLFGSYAKKEYRKDSDIDLALYFKGGVDLFEEKLRVHHNLERTLKKEIDLLCLNQAKNIYLLETVLKEGIVVKEKDKEERKLFEVEKQHMIIDFKEFRKVLYAS